MNISELRKEYQKAELSEESVNPDPIGQFDSWFTEAQKSGIDEPNAMVLSTVDPSGQPSSRTVLLKAYDERGFVFYTNYSSRKSIQLETNPRAVTLFPWVALERQVIIEGNTERISRAETVKYFLKRPFGSQLGAWVSDQSRVISSRKMLEMKWEEMKRKYRQGEVPVPDHWGGIRIIPHRIEFWQGRPNRLHDRILYTKEASSWKIQRLAP